MTNLKVCTSELMISDTRGIGLALAWYPRIVSEQFLESTKDGPIKLSPDPVTMIDGDMTWYNDTGSDQRVWVNIHRAPRSIVAQSPSTVAIHDAWSWRVAESPTAEFPSVIQDTFGGRMQIDRASAAPDQLQFGRWYLDGDDSQRHEDLGVVPAGQQFHFRYLAAVQTPGAWAMPSEFEPRWEAYARWTRLQALAFPA